MEYPNRRAALIIELAHTGDDRYLKAAGLQYAIVTAHPFDLSGGKIQANTKKVRSAPAYRIVVEADEERQKLGVACGKMVAAADAKQRLA